jgi:hypothetical protein
MEENPGEPGWSVNGFGFGLETATLQDPSTLALGAPAPDAVVDAIPEGVLEARLLDRAVGADAARDFDAHAVAWEECVGRLLGTEAPSHPAGVHRVHLPCVLLHTHRWARKFP